MQISKEELERLRNLCFFEESARKQGFTRIAGVDEVGRGPLAGPVVAAACVIPEGIYVEGVKDSKQLPSARRFSIYQQLIQHPDISYGIGIIETFIIDQINILQATLEAMRLAVKNLQNPPGYILVDGNQLPFSSDICMGIVGGDSRSLSIAAASIIAKETRDQMMRAYHEKWPHYGFNKHKGYGTPEHVEALKNYGTCPIHRLSFKIVRENRFPTRAS